MKMTCRSLIVLAYVALTGCITVPPPEERSDTKPPPPSTPPTEVVREKVIETTTVSDTDRLLSYYSYASALSKERLAKELEQTRRFYDSTGGSFARMQLVLIRLASSSEQRERDKALELLQVQLSAKNDNHTELHALASLLRQLLGENHQLESSLESQKEKLKEETKKSEALKQKLDALVEAERKLLERNRPK